MCTATWRTTADGYVLYFNRDESRSRQAAAPPRRIDRGGMPLLAPADGDFGGTWIATNATGLTVALLNRYQDHAKAGPGPFISRGLLVLDLAEATDWLDLDARLDVLDFNQYRPFTLLVVEAQGEAFRAAWDGRRRLPNDRPEPPMASSGYDPEGIEALRHQIFAEFPAEGTEALHDFHRSHRPDRGPFSPCMHRFDASTVSLTRVEVHGGRITMAYADGPPCRTSLGPTVVLPRGLN